MNISRSELRSMIRKILSERFTIPKGTRNTQWPKFTESDDLEEIYASEIGDDPRAEMGGDPYGYDEEPGDSLYTEEDYK